MNYVQQLKIEQQQHEDKIANIDEVIDEIQSNCEHAWVEDETSITYFFRTCTICDEVEAI